MNRISSRDRHAAILASDAVGFANLMAADKYATLGALDAARVIFRAKTSAHHGRVVDTAGDSVLAVFESASDAVGAALDAQQALEENSAGTAESHRLRFRVGVDMGDVIEKADGSVYGTGVNIAARLQSLVGPGETAVSSAVRDRVTDGLGLTLEDMGERWLKGIESPVHMFRAWPPGPAPHIAASKLRGSHGQPAIAVLPFRNLSGDASHVFLGELLAEDLIGAFSRQTGLFVISRLSTTPFRDRVYEPRNVAEILGVQYVLTGIMQISGSRLRLICELTEAALGRVVWADRFDGSLDDVFELQDQLSHDVAERVLPFLRQRELERVRWKRPESLTAYERTLRAIDIIHRSSAQSLEQASDMLQAATRSDPLYAAPLAWLAYCHVRRVGQGWSPDPERDRVEANRHAQAALDRDDTDPWVLSISGLVHAYLNKDLPAAIDMYDQALRINPSAAAAWAWSTSAYAWLGQGQEATKRAPQAIRLSPLDPNMYSFNSVAGVAHLVAGDYVAAVEYCRRSLRQNRMFSSTHRLLTIALVLADRVDEARLAARELLNIEPNITQSGFQLRYPGAATPQAKIFAQALGVAGIPP